MARWMWRGGRVAAVMAVAVATACGSDGGAAAGGDAATGDEPAGVDGVYRWASSTDDAMAAGVGVDADYEWADDELVLFENTFTLTLEDAAWTLETTASSRMDGGSFTVAGDRLTFDWETPQTVGDLELEFTYSVDSDGDLDLEPVVPMDPGDQFLFGAYELTKVS